MDPVASSSLTPSTQSHDRRAFTRVTQGLMAIGAVSLLQYLTNFPSHITHTTYSTSPQQAQPLPTQSDHNITRAVARLHQACQHTFGNTEALRFVYEDDKTTNEAKRCILTITRPNGDSRTYASPSFHTRKYDAKASVCTLAIHSGAIDFILSGNSNSSSPPSLSVPDSDPPNTLLDMDESVKAIEQCCLDWTGGKVRPFWLNINEPNFARTQGCALRIRLGERKCRVHSVNAIYDGPVQAKKACAEAALAEGVIAFIKTWSPSDATSANVNDEKGTDNALTLQQFFDSLPTPFPEPVSGKTAIDINGPAWLNTTIQSHRGGKIVPNFVWTVDTRLNLHGCLLRLERPGEVKSYLVDARFSKRAEAKGAVCLLAMSEGVGDYIRSVGKAVEDKLSPSTRQHVVEVLLPTLNAEYRKVRGAGHHPTFEFSMDVDACGASMTLELVQNPSPQQVQKYTVPAEYRNRNDAKLAVVLHAVEQGAIEFLRFHGKPPPPGYVPHYAQQDNQFLNRKRKNWESGGGHTNGSGSSEWSNNGGHNGHARGGGTWQYKKPRFGGGSFQQGQGNFPTPAPRGNGSFGQGQNGVGYHNGNKSGWSGQKKQQQPYGSRKPHGPGPGHYGGGTGYAAPPANPGPRNSGGPSPPMHQQRQRFHGPALFGSVPPPQSTPIISSPPFRFPGGPVAGGTQPLQAPYFGAVPQALQPQVLPHVAAVQSPFAASPSALGGIVYPSFPQSQPQPPVVGGPVPLQYPQQYHQYGATAAYASLSGLGQVPGYQSFPQAAPQPYPTGFYPTPATTPAPAPGPPPIVPPVPVAPASIQPTPFYYAGPPTSSVRPTNTPAVFAASPAFTAYRSSFGPLTAHSPVLHVSPPPPTPQPPQPSTAPPPPPPPTVAAPQSLPLDGVSSKPVHGHPQTLLNIALGPTSASTDAPRAVESATAPSSSSKSGKVAIHSVAKTNVSALYDLCLNNDQPPPQWCHEIVKDDDGKGEPKHKVWVVIGKTKFELPVTFSSLSQGQEKIAKKVVDQFKGNPGQLARAAKS